LLISVILIDVQTQHMQATWRVFRLIVLLLFGLIQFHVAFLSGLWYK